MTKIKFCGLTRLSDIQAANTLLPDYIGFVFAQKSKRYVDIQIASSLKKNLRANIKSVGVFVNEKIDNIIKMLNLNIIDVIQLHGTENKLYIKELRNFTDKIIIQAFKIQSCDDVLKASESLADYVLLDSGNGTGKTFNWDILASMNFKRDYFLAGGLNPENVSLAIQILKPFAVDVSSGIESNSLKDISKMSAFISNVRKL